MLLEFTSEKNNITAVSQFDFCSQQIEDKTYGVITKAEMDWRITLGVTGDCWIKFNFIEPVELYEIDFTAGGPLEYWEVGYVQPWDSVVIEHSLDNRNWYTLEPKGLNDWSGYTDIKPVFIRIRFTNTIAGFHFDECNIYGNEEIKINDELVSLTSKRYYPQRYFEQNVMMPYVVNDYLVMLEGDTIEKFYTCGDCSTTIYYISNGDNGGINNNAINTIPLNGYGSAVGAGKATLNRVEVIDADYNLAGRFVDYEGNLTSIPLKFNSIIECSGGASIDLSAATSFVWEFDDPFATSSNPNHLIVSSYGEVQHSFSSLGTYDIRFVIEIDGTTIEDTFQIEILPGLYTPLPLNGDFNVTNGSIWKVYGLTSWSTGTYSLPEFILRDVAETPSVAVLTDNGDGTFTATTNGEIQDCRIKIWDDFYEEYQYLDVTFNLVNLPLQDSGDFEILDSNDLNITQS